jgi:hypothetical protein
MLLIGWGCDLLLKRADEVIEERCLLQCMSLFLALFGHRSDERRCPLLGSKLKSVATPSWMGAAHRQAPQLDRSCVDDEIIGWWSGGSADTPAIFTRSSPPVLTPIK